MNVLFYRKVNSEIPGINMLIFNNCKPDFQNKNGLSKVLSIKEKKDVIRRKVYILYEIGRKLTESPL